MNYSYAWKIVSHLSPAETALVIMLCAGAIVVACIALWNAVPMGFEYSMELWHRRMRRNARKRWYARRELPRKARATQRIDHDAPRAPRAGRGLPSKAWLAIAGCSAASVLAGVALGYILNRQPDHSSVNARLTEALRDPARLRIDYELRNR